MISILILICSLTTPRAACQIETALDVIQGPRVESEVMCGLHGQALAAETELRREGEYVKIMCRRSSMGANWG